MSFQDVVRFIKKIHSVVTDYIVICLYELNHPIDLLENHVDPEESAESI